MTDPNQTPVPQPTPPAIFSPLTPEQQQHLQQLQQLQQQQQQQPPQFSATAIAMQSHLAALAKLLDDLTKDYEQYKKATEARLETSKKTEHDLSTHVTSLLTDHASLATTVQQNDAHNQQQLTSMQPTITNQASMITKFINSHPTPAASPITLSPADVQNDIKDGLIAFWQNASSQGMSPSQTIAATGITPASQAQPPTQVVATINTQNKKPMLGSIIFGHLNPDELPPSAVETYVFQSDKTHQNWIKTNTLTHFISPHYGLSQFAKHCTCPIRFEELLHNTIDGFYINKDFDKAYEAIFAMAPTACPTWLDIPTGETPAHVVCKDRIYALVLMENNTMKPNCN